MISRGRILCTEDEADIRDLLAFVLGQQGYAVECTDSAEEALARARDESFDLFLFDNWLPGMSGIELTRQVRTFNFKTPILFCSGVAYGKDQEEAREAGAQGYLVKPIDTDELILEVARLITETRIAHLANVASS